MFNFQIKVHLYRKNKVKFDPIIMILNRKGFKGSEKNHRVHVMKDTILAKICDYTLNMLAHYSKRSDLR